jgi:hypothetical protein
MNHYRGSGYSNYEYNNEYSGGGLSVTQELNAYLVHNSVAWSVSRSLVCNLRRAAPVAESQSLTKRAFLSKIHSSRFHQRIYKEAG